MKRVNLFKCIYCNKIIWWLQKKTLINTYLHGIQLVSLHSHYNCHFHRYCISTKSWEKLPNGSFKKLIIDNNMIS